MPGIVNRAGRAAGHGCIFDGMDTRETSGSMILARRGDGRFELRAGLWLPRPIGEVFEFFSDAGNLDAITPNSIRFVILTPRPVDMHEGTLLDYRLKVRGVPLRWRSLISAWEPPHRFVDEQVRGPYRTWIHEHTFEERDGGTLCGDHVIYDMICGRLANALFVQRDLRHIWEYRCAKLRELVGGERG